MEPIQGLANTNPIEQSNAAVEEKNSAKLEQAFNDALETAIIRAGTSFAHVQQRQNEEIMKDFRES